MMFLQGGRSNRSTTCVVFTMLMLALLVVVGPKVHAQGWVASQTLTAPNNPVNNLGFKVEVTWYTPVDVGYFPLRIALISNNMFVADRRLTFRLEPVEGGHSPSQNGIAAEVTVQADQGSKQKIVDLQIPKWSVGDGYELRVYDGSTRLDGYTISLGKVTRRSNQTPNDLTVRETAMNWLEIWPKIQDVPEAFITPEEMSLVESDRGRMVSTLRHVETRLQVRTFDRLPQDWRSYQSFDAVVVNFSDLDLLAEKHPVRLTAIRQWMMLGGMVIVHHAPSLAEAAENLSVGHIDDPKSNESVELVMKTMLTERRNLDQQISAKIQLLKDVLEQPESERYRFLNQIEMDTEIAAQLRNNPQFTDTDLEAKLVIQEQSRKIVDAVPVSPRFGRHIWMQTVGAGRLVGIHSSSRLNIYDWSTVFQLFIYQQSPVLRRGVDPTMGDKRVRRWLIPGVAEPPVYTFIGLLTLFVILVGPVAYRLTTKSGRGYLMFAIAPVLAVVTTVTMLGYGVMADGFGSVTRIRQLTYVDGYSGDAAERVRSTYFAGVRPKEGLRFAGNAEVMAYPDNNGAGWRELAKKDFAIKGKVTLRDDAQIFDASFLPSRSQQQFVVHQPRPKLGRLKLLSPESASGIPMLSSSFEFTLREVVIRDTRGKYWWLDSVDANASDVPCQRLSLKESSKRLSDLYIRYRPVSETAWDSRSSSYRSDIYDLVNHVNRQLGLTSQTKTDGVFENWLQTTLQLDAELVPGTFIGISDISKDVVAVQDAEVVASVRFVYGTLP